MNYELLTAFLSVREPSRISRGTPSEHWFKLFRYYNENSGEKRLGMSCSPCFEKVYAYCKHILLVMAMNEPKSEIDKWQQLNEKHADQMKDVKIPGEK
jgi:hypothetical protein